MWGGHFTLLCNLMKETDNTITDLTGVQPWSVCADPWVWSPVWRLEGRSWVPTLPPWVFQLPLPQARCRWHVYDLLLWGTLCCPSYTGKWMTDKLVCSRSEGSSIVMDGWNCIVQNIWCRFFLVNRNHSDREVMNGSLEEMIVITADWPKIPDIYIRL